jgi:hypothetical protein
MKLARRVSLAKEYYEEFIEAYNDYLVGRGRGFMLFND